MKPRNIMVIFLLAVFILPVFTACSPATKSITVGIVTPAASMEAVIDGFKAAMAENGYVEGEDIIYIYNGPKTGAELAEEAASLVDQNVDVLLGLATPGALAAQAAVAGTNIPVVYAPISDPVGVGLANSIIAPGNNMTGITSAGFVPKELEWLLRTTPQIKTIFAPYNPADGGAVYGYNLLKDAAEILKVDVITPEIASSEEISDVLADMPADVDAIFMLTDSMILSNIEAFVAVARERNLPLTSINYSQVEAGALLAYGPEFGSVGRQTARLVDQILKGADAGSLPVENAQYFLYLNQKVAVDLGIVFPDEVLKAAEEIIR